MKNEIELKLSETKMFKIPHIYSEKKKHWRKSTEPNPFVLRETC